MLNMTGLDPSALWRQFQELSVVPRPVKHEQAVVEYVREIGQRLGLFSQTDEVGNIVLRKPASPGMEHRSAVILQCHLDMLPEKNTGAQHDSQVDPVRLAIEGEWLTAEGASLGANGIAISAALAVLEADDIEHGPLEVLFTVEGEGGMAGARHLRPGLLEGRTLLNLNADRHGKLFVGCAGSIDVVVEHSYVSERLQEGYSTRRVCINGLKGGHSGCDINLQRANANKLMVRLLKCLSVVDVRVISIKGGSFRNAIPREAFAEIAVPSEKLESAIHIVEELVETVQAELAEGEPDVAVFMVDAGESTAGRAMPLIDQRSWLDVLHALPDGIERMSLGIQGVVETSSNLALVEIQNGSICVEHMVRSLIDSAREDHADALQGLYRLLGARVSTRNGYPGWKPAIDSQVVKIMTKAHHELFEAAPDISVLHAGLECALLGSTYPQWDMVSFGPTINFAHSPDEKVHLPSVSHFWALLKHSLKNIP